MSGSTSDCSFSPRDGFSRDYFWFSLSRWGTNLAATLCIHNSSFKIRWQGFQDTPVISITSSIIQYRSSKICSWILMMFGGRRSPGTRLVLSKYKMELVPALLFVLIYFENFPLNFYSIFLVHFLIMLPWVTLGWERSDLKMTQGLDVWQLLPPRKIFTLFITCWWMAGDCLLIK